MANNGNGKGNGNGRGRDKDGLTPKQALFCREYLIDRNGAGAAIRAGFSRKGAKTAGSRLLANVHVRAKIDTLVEAQLEKVEMDLEEIVETASRIGRATVDQLFSPDGEWSLLHPRELPADIRAAVSSVDVVVGPDGNTHYKYRLWPKLAALDLIAKLRGLVTKKTDLDVTLTWRQVLEKMDEEDAAHAAVVRQLLRAGADPQRADLAGNEALHLAANASIGGNERAIQFLIDAGADHGRTNRAGQTPLHRAAASQRAPRVRVLLDAGASPDARDNTGETPLMVAADVLGGDATITSMLLAAGANPRLTNDAGWTAT